MKAQPLKGKRIVVTRSAGANKAWTAYLRKEGAIVYEFPTIETAPVAPNKKLAHALAHLNEFGWIVFTSAAGPYAMRAHMKKLRIKLPKPGTKKTTAMPRIAAIGDATADAVRSIGCRVAFTPSISDSRTLARELSPLRSPVLLLRADIASGELPRALRARGIRVTDMPIYTTKLIHTDPSARLGKLFQEKKIDHIVFASPSSVQGFSARMKKSLIKTAQDTPVVAIGPRTAKAVRGASFRTVHTARVATIRSVTDAITDAIRER